MSQIDRKGCNRAGFYLSIGFVLWIWRAGFLKNDGNRCVKWIDDRRGSVQAHVGVMEYLRTSLSSRYNNLINLSSLKTQQANTIGYRTFYIRCC